MLKDVPLVPIICRPFAGDKFSNMWQYIFIIYLCRKSVYSSGGKKEKKRLLVLMDTGHHTMKIPLHRLKKSRTDGLNKPGHAGFISSSRNSENENENEDEDKDEDWRTGTPLKKVSPWYGKNMSCYFFFSARQSKRMDAFRPHRMGRQGWANKKRVLSLNQGNLNINNHWRKNPKSNVHQYWSIWNNFQKKISKFKNNNIA